MTYQLLIYKDKSIALKKGDEILRVKDSQFGYAITQIRLAYDKQYLAVFKRVIKNG